MQILKDHFFWILAFIFTFVEMSSASAGFKFEYNRDSILTYTYENQGQVPRWKESSFCFSCTGSRELELLNFFRQISEQMKRCEQPLGAPLERDLFLYGDLVPFEFFAPFNPNRLTDPDVRKQVSALCPAETKEVLVLAIAKPATGHLISVNLMSCDGVLYPIRDPLTSCQTVEARIEEYVSGRRQWRQAIQAQLVQSASLMDYQLIRYSDYVQAEYLRCTPSAPELCLAICGSERSCNFLSSSDSLRPYLNQLAQKSYRICPQTLSADVATDYLMLKSRVVIDSSSLSLTFESPYDQMSNSDLSVIDHMLEELGGGLGRAAIWLENGNSEFYITEDYRKKIQKVIDQFCPAGARGTVMGQGGEVDLVICNGVNRIELYPVIESGKSCREKSESIRQKGLIL